MSAPCWDEIASYIGGFCGVSLNEIREYLMPYEYSWRRVQTCIHLAIQSPEIWQQLLVARRREKKITTEHITLQQCISDALDPYALVMESSDFGACIARGGSLWALLGSEGAPGEHRTN
jgi:hypothetical protein